MTGNALNPGVVESIDHDFVVWPEPAEFRTDRSGCAAFRTTEDPPTKDPYHQKDSASENDADFFHFS
jgi:hypothetical protein